MADTTPLRRKDVIKEVKRIKMLPPEQREEHYKALHNRVSEDIDLTSARINYDQLMGEEQRRLLYCVLAFPKEYRNSIYEVYEKAFSQVLLSKGPDKVKDIEKVNTAHVSGLPLPEHAKVRIWWQHDKLIFASASTEFSLPAERVMGMGTTSQMTADALGGHNTYFTVEYKKEVEIKAIVVRVSTEVLVSHLIRYFNKIKGTRETIKQEL